MLADQIKAFGFRVFMRDPSDTYAYFSDGEYIGYAQYCPYEGWTLATVHYPNPSSGTGYQVCRHVSTPTRALLETALDRSNAAWGFSQEVKKYESLDAFLNASDWNKGFKEQ